MKKFNNIIIFTFILIILFPTLVLALEDDVNNEEIKIINNENEIINKESEETTSEEIIVETNNDLDKENIKEEKEETTIKEEIINEEIIEEPIIENDNNIEANNNTSEKEIINNENINNENINNENINNEHINIVKADNENNDDIVEIPKNGLPLVIIRVNEDDDAIEKARQKDPDHEYGDIEAVNGSIDHSIRGIGTIEIILPENYVNEYGTLTIPEGPIELEYLRGRGNITWNTPKKPYKFKYTKKQDILGMGANKEWALLANYLDKTLTNNAIAMYISRELGMEYSTQMVPVEVIMIGSKSGKKYLGSYYLSELVDIGNGRVELPELKENEDDVENGGYLISIYYDSQDYDKPKSTIFSTKHSGLEFMNENPSFDSEDLTEAQEKQRKYIRGKIDEIDDLIVNNEVIDENIHNKIDKLLDLKSTADYWLIQEFLINFDAYKTSSNYLYKKPGADGKIYWGPLWDFDLIFYLKDTEPESATGFNNYTPNPWLDSLRDKDPLFVELLKERWQILEPILANLTKEGGKLDEYKERQRSTWQINYDMWMDGYFAENVDYDSAFEKLRNLIDFRRQWFNENIDKIGNVYYTVNYEIDGKIVKTMKVRAESYLYEIDITPEKEGCYFEGWVDKETNENMISRIIDNNITFVPSFMDPNEIEEDIVWFLSHYEVWVPLEDEEYEGNYPKIFPEDYAEILGKNIILTSSNENIATIEKGIVKLHSVGDVVITGTLFDGTSKSYLLHVFDENSETIDEPENLYVEQEEYTIETGEIIQIISNLLPNMPVNPSTYIGIEREVENEEIIEIDYSDCYVIKGLKEGETTITLYLYSDFSDRYYAYKTIKINVIAKKEEQQEEKEEEQQPIVPTENKIDNNGTGTTAPSDNSNKDTTNSIIPIKIVNTNKNNKPAITKSHGEETEEVSQEENVEKIDEVKEEDNKATKTVKEESAKEEEEIDQKSLIIIGLVIIGLIACLSFILLKNSKGNEELYL